MDTETQSLPYDSRLSISSEDLDSIAEPSQSFVGNWKSLISQTNWEKGQIIFQWRARLQESGVTTRLYSDPAWSRLVGEVTPQHVGRLRRTWEKFGKVFVDYEGLYWSHFFAALEWEDAEMWLEGAVQNQWSVSAMRYQRWETLGKLKDQEPDPAEIVTSSGDEGASEIASTTDSGETVYKDDLPTMQGPLREGPDFGDEDVETTDGLVAGQPQRESQGDKVDMELILADMPDTMSLPFRQLRSAIMEARDNDWVSVQRIDVIAMLNDLKMLLRKPPKPSTEPESS